MQSSKAPFALLQILDDFRRIVRVLRESSRASESALGVTGAQLFVLRALANCESLSINELADRTHTHQSSVSTVVKRLTDSGLVRRTRSSLDRRRAELVITDRGRELVAKAPTAVQERLIAAIEALAPGMQHELAESLHAVVEKMGLRDPSPPMFFDDDTHETETNEEGKSAANGCT